MSKVCCVLYIKSPFKKLNLSNQNKHKLSVVTEKISTDPLEENHKSYGKVWLDMYYNDSTY